MLKTHPVPGKKKSEDLCRRVAESAPPSVTGHVFYGVKEGNFDAWKRVLASGEDYYVIDNSYFDRARGVQYRVTKNRFQHTGQGATTGERFRALGYTVKPQRQAAGAVRWLLVEQSPVHMRCVAQDEGWLARQQADLNGRNARTRPWSADKPRLSTTLHEDLAWADVLVTHSSAAAVEAVIEGLPTVTSPMSAVYHMVHRETFLGVLADNQWTLDEITEGAIWR